MNSFKIILIIGISEVLLSK